jgi:hypothetical protein
MNKKKRSGVGARVLKALQRAERFSRGKPVPGIRHHLSRHQDPRKVEHALADFRDWTDGLCHTV